MHLEPIHQPSSFGNSGRDLVIAAIDEFGVVIVTPAATTELEVLIVETIVVDVVVVGMDATAVVEDEVDEEVDAEVANTRRASS